MNELVKEALIFATTAHTRAGQLRDYTSAPYIVHPIAVMMTLQRHGINRPDVLAASLLHDVVEDTPAKNEDIAALFGWQVANLVAFVTNAPGEPEAAKLLRVSTMCPEAQAIKCADIIDNCANLHNLDPARAAVYLPKRAAMVDAMIQAPRALRIEAARATNWRPDDRGIWRNPLTSVKPNEALL